MLRLLQGVWICHMLAWMVMGMVMVMVDGEVWQSGQVYLLVWEVMLHQGESQGVVEEVMVMELMVVVRPKIREWQGHEAWGCRHLRLACARRRIPWPTRHRPHRGRSALRILELFEIIL